MSDIDLFRIRPFSGSQANAFEELCCQLASLEEYGTRARWIRKEGAGGDAGVEGYWQLPDGSEHCWQAKFFRKLDQSQLQQLDNSVRTALELHPQCTRYVICLPIDLTEHRSETARSQRDRWNERVRKWEGWIKSGRELSFELWGRHELVGRLTRDEPKYSGRVLYWFGYRQFTPAWFAERFEESKANLGERYVAKDNVELSIAHSFEALGCWPTFRDRLTRLPNPPIRPENGNHWKEEIRSLLDELNEVRDDIRGQARAKKFPLRFSGVKQRLDELQVAASELHEKTLEQQQNQRFEPKQNRDHERELLRLQSAIERHRLHVRSKKVSPAEHTGILLVGGAGIGKSHLLADVADRALRSDCPAVLLLGSHFHDNGTPWRQVCDLLDIDSTGDQLFGALDAVGQARGVRTLLCIDALNETQGPQYWRQQLSGFIQKIARFPNIALVVSCRSTYQQRVIGANLRPSMLLLEHSGFRVSGNAAARRYLDSRGIYRTSAPTLHPEMANPLFLKTLCDALIRRGSRSIPKGLRGVTKIFDYYIDSVEETIRLRLETDSSQNVVARYVNALIERMHQTEVRHVRKVDALELMESIFPSHGSERRSLLTALLDEGVLTEDITYTNPTDSIGVDVIRFTFERFADHFVANTFLEKHLDRENPDALFERDGPFMTLVDDNVEAIEGLVEALSVQIPERINKELPDLVPRSEQSSWLRYVLVGAFAASLVSRDPECTNENTIACWQRLIKETKDENLMEAFARILTEPKHALNGEFLDSRLRAYSMPDRDARWATWIARAWTEGEDEETSSLNDLVDWAWFSDTAYIEEERLKLAAISLAWMLSTPRRSARDKATKALVSLLTGRISLVRYLLLKFDRIDDFYIKERLYAVAYGVAMRASDIDVLDPLVRTVVRRAFRRRCPPIHILLRDYARGVVERAISVGSLYAKHHRNLASPQYESPWPLADPGVEETKERQSRLGGVSHSVMAGDFGIYVMNDVFHFSATERAVGAPKTWADLLNRFVGRIQHRTEAKTAWDQFVNAKQERDSARVEQYEALRASSGPQIPPIIVIEFAADDASVSPEMKVVRSAEDRLERAKEKLESTLTRDEAEEFRWLNGARSGDVAIFSRRLAKRWILKRVEELGWDESLFGEFDRIHSRQFDRFTHNFERIGKKYQWIAYHELLARMADHLHFFEFHHERGEYEGPWQLLRRDLDPSLLKPSIREEWKNSSDRWWGLDQSMSQIDTQDDGFGDWLRVRSDIPSAEDLILLTDPTSGRQRLNLASFQSLDETHESIKPWRTVASWVQALVFERSEAQQILERWKDQNLLGGFEGGQVGAPQAFLTEYPWHVAWRMDGPIFDDLRQLNRNVPDIRAHSPTHKYHWESGGYDYSIDDTVEIYVPSPYLCSLLGLSLDSVGLSFRDRQDIVRFCDAHLANGGPPAGLIDAESFLSMVREQQLGVVWSVVTTKRLIDPNSSFKGEPIDCQVIAFDGSAFSGIRWTLMLETGPQLTVLESASKLHIPNLHTLE